MYIETLGDNIRAERLNQKLTQEQLAEKADISAVFLSQIENGRKNASIDTIYKITSSLGIALENAFKENYICDMEIDSRIDLLLRGKSEKDKILLFDIIKYIADRLEKEKGKEKL